MTRPHRPAQAGGDRRNRTQRLERSTDRIVIVSAILSVHQLEGPPGGTSDGAPLSPSQRRTEFGDWSVNLDVAFRLNHPSSRIRVAVEDQHRLGMAKTGNAPETVDDEVS